MMGSATVWAKSSGAAVSSLVTTSSLANLRWKAETAHFCCVRNAGVNVEMDRGVARKALVGVALMARTAERRRRNLDAMSNCRYI